MIATLATRGEKGAESVDEIRQHPDSRRTTGPPKPRDSPEVTKKTPKNALSSARAHQWT